MAHLRTEAVRVANTQTPSQEVNGDAGGGAEEVVAVAPNDVQQGAKIYAPRVANWQQRAQAISQANEAEPVAAVGQTVQPAVEEQPARRKLASAAASKGKVSSRTQDVIHTLWSGLTSAVVGYGKTVGHGLQAMGQGVASIFNGNPWVGVKSIVKGIAKITVQAPIDATLMLKGRAISAAQTMVGLEPPGRTMSLNEIAEMQKIFGNSIDYTKVRIKEGRAGVWSLIDAPITHGDTIYVPQKQRGAKFIRSGLAQQMTHVYQHQQTGTGYMSSSLVAAMFGEGSDYSRKLAQGKSWSQLNPLQQAALIQDAHSQGFFDEPEQKAVIEGIDYTPNVEEALTSIQRSE